MTAATCPHCHKKAGQYDGFRLPTRGPVPFETEHPSVATPLGYLQSGRCGSCGVALILNSIHGVYCREADRAEAWADIALEQRQ